MERPMYIRGGLALLVMLLLASCSAATAEATPTPYPEEVDWETAVEILNSGNVQMVVQLHSLDMP